ncbi:hypothetical protein CR152_17845 [Massilia violaceinigra]|uniref:Uncharacterized protein n=1 Tax=Massilia violaceinigra TaxID=2045208 RepID=A0A2D2DMI6_9BURK|nr:hypothetical protein [Massilia violaceinigra]ATQ76188.1 hypothetical protein CR152_17845 [Massilia violaceinigra]
MLLKNDLLYYPAQARTIRILWIDSAASVAYTFELGAKGAHPVLAPLAALGADLREQRARVLASDPHASNGDSAALPARHRQVRDRAWAVVQALVADEPAIYQARHRGRLVMAQSALHGVSHPSVYRYLRRFWERGQHPDALLPDYKNSGAPGKSRGSSANVKRGRPRKSGSHPGLNADDGIRRTFHAAVARYSATHAQFSRRGAYRQMIQDFFDARDAELLPTFGQFNYWIGKDAPAASAAA